MQSSSRSESSKGRPVVFDYGMPHLFLSDLYEHYKQTRNFSLRQKTKKVEGCSQSLVSQILSGKRNLNRDNLLPLSQVFSLTESEIEYLDECIAAGKKGGVTFTKAKNRERVTQNHILTNWLNPFVKDLVNLRGFHPDPQVLSGMLKEVASKKQVEKSVKFLFEEGFWRRSPSGRVVPSDDTVVSTNEIANEKIKKFHKKALDIAKRGLELWPMDKRKASTVLVSVDEKKLSELRGLIDSFQGQLLKFIESHPDGKDSLVQVTIHMTPVGEKADE